MAAMAIMYRILTYMYIYICDMAAMFINQCVLCSNIFMYIYIFYIDIGDMAAIFIIHCVLLYLYIYIY